MSSTNFIEFTTVLITCSNVVCTICYLQFFFFKLNSRNVREPAGCVVIVPTYSIPCNIIIPNHGCFFLLPCSLDWSNVNDHSYIFHICEERRSVPSSFCFSFSDNNKSRIGNGELGYINYVYELLVSYPLLCLYSFIYKIKWV